MGVFINGMVMPRVCAECFMDPPCCEALSGDINIWKERHPNCPLVEVKEPHGDLADKLMRDIEEYHLSDGKFQHWVEVQQTIIEAEGSET